MCGALNLVAVGVSGGGGSSPHVRGTCLWGWPRLLLVRIIPACAGHLPIRTTQRARLLDHPRMCGALFCLLEGAGYPDGSSPHVRGTYFIQFHPADHKRIIPACAGHFKTFRAKKDATTDHPRMCGAL